MPPSHPAARVSILMTCTCGALALLAGLYFLGVAARLLLRGEIDWARDYRGVIAGAVFIAAGILGIKGSVFRRRSGEHGDITSSQDR
jgi:hypothetical protein